MTTPTLPATFWDRSGLGGYGFGGYGRVYMGVDTPEAYAHRLAYEALVGPIPDGKELDHLKDLCSSTACLKVIADETGPAHLEPVTHRENLLRGNGIAAINAAKTHCPQGHPYDAANTYIRRFRYGTGRDCRACGAARNRAARHARKQAA